MSYTPEKYKEDYGSYPPGFERYQNPNKHQNGHKKEKYAWLNEGKLCMKDSDCGGKSYYCEGVHSWENPFDLWQGRCEVKSEYK